MQFSTLYQSNIIKTPRKKKQKSGIFNLQSAVSTFILNFLQSTSFQPGTPGLCPLLRTCAIYFCAMDLWDAIKEMRRLSAEGVPFSFTFMSYDATARASKGVIEVRHARLLKREKQENHRDAEFVEVSKVVGVRGQRPCGLSRLRQTQEGRKGFRWKAFRREPSSGVP